MSYTQSVSLALACSTRRLRAVLRPLALALGVLGLAAAGAQAQVRERVLDEQSFVLGNTLKVLLHEVGHALVDLWALPVLGREEDAADAFSVIYLLDTIESDADLSTEQMEQLDDALFVSAVSWLAFAEENDLEDTTLFADEHSLDMQRFFSHMCLLVGRNEDLYADWFVDFDIEDEALDIERCEELAVAQSEDWRYLLEVERDQSWKDQGKAGIKIDIDRGKTKQHRRYEAWLKDWAWLPYLEARLERDLKLPETLNMRFTDCDEANAFYDPETREVIMCYELMEVFEDLLEY